MNARVLLLAAAVALGAASPAPAPTPIHLVASYGAADAVYAPAWIAARTGAFVAHGLDVVLQYQASAVQIPSLISGDVKIALVGCGEVVAANAAGADLVMLANLAPVVPYLFMVPSEIKRAADLRGKPVGVSKFGDTTDVSTRIALQKLGLTPADVSFVQVGSSTNRAAALLSGAIAGGVLSPPVTAEIAKHGYHAMVDLAKLRVPAMLALTARRSWIDANPETVQRYVDALLDGIAREKRDKAFTVGILREYLKVDDPAILGAAYDYYANEVVPTTPHATAEQCRLVLDTLAATNERLKGIDISAMIDDRFVAASARRRR